jgi:transposase
VPVRCWTFPGNASDQVIIRTIKDDLAGWMLNRVVWVADRGFNSVGNRAYLQRGGGHYVVAEKLRNASGEAKEALARPGRYQVAAGNLQVKEVRVGEGARSQRFVVCHNPDGAERDQQVRANLVAYLETQIEGSDEWTKSRRDELTASCAPRQRCGDWSVVSVTDGSASTRRPSRTRRSSTASGCCVPVTTA